MGADQALVFRGTDRRTDRERSAGYTPAAAASRDSCVHDHSQSIAVGVHRRLSLHATLFAQVKWWRIKGLVDWRKLCLCAFIPVLCTRE
jgi:hypothetical protein